MICKGELQYFHTLKNFVTNLTMYGTLNFNICSPFIIANLLTFVKTLRDL